MGWCRRVGGRMVTRTELSRDGMVVRRLDHSRPTFVSGQERALVDRIGGNGGREEGGRGFTG
jgi:hypothetical protein